MNKYLGQTFFGLLALAFVSVTSVSVATPIDHAQARQIAKNHGDKLKKRKRASKKSQRRGAKQRKSVKKRSRRYKKRATRNKYVKRKPGKRRSKRSTRKRSTARRSIKKRSATRRSATRRSATRRSATRRSATRRSAKRRAPVRRHAPINRHIDSYEHRYHQPRRYLPPVVAAQQIPKEDSRHEPIINQTEPVQRSSLHVAPVPPTGQPAERRGLDSPYATPESKPVDSPQRKVQGDNLPEKWTKNCWNDPYIGTRCRYIKNN